MCDRSRELNARDMCAECETEFQSTMKLVRCASGECDSPLTCRMEKRCVQIRAAVRIITPGQPVRVPDDARRLTHGNLRRMSASDPETPTGDDAG